MKTPVDNDALKDILNQFDEQFDKISFELVQILFILFGVFLFLISGFVNYIFYGVTPYKILFDFLTQLGLLIIITIVYSILFHIFVTKKVNSCRRPKMKEYLHHVHSQFDIMGITLNDFNTQIDARELLIQKAMKTNATYRFIFVNPDSKALLVRATEEGETITMTDEGEETFNMKTKCEKTKETLRNIKISITEGNHGSIVKVYQYEQIPRRSVIITDDKLFVGPYFIKRPGLETAWAEIPHSPLRKDYEREFDALCTKENEIFI